MKTYKNYYPQILTGASLVGLVASFWQAAERVHILKNPNAILSCNINPVIDCGTVMGHKLAALFGFPNTFIGMVMFSMLFMVGMGMWMGVKLTQKFRNLIMALNLVAILFSFWFFGVSLYVIGKICLFCLAIWPASVVLFWYGLLYWMSEKKRKSSVESKILDFAEKNHLLVVIAVYVVMFLMFLARFRDYYFN